MCELKTKTDEKCERRERRKITEKFLGADACAFVILHEKWKTGAMLENLNLDFFTTASEEQFGEQEKPLCAQ